MNHKHSAMENRQPFWLVLASLVLFVALSPYVWTNSRNKLNSSVTQKTGHAPKVIPESATYLEPVLHIVTPPNTKYPEVSRQQNSPDGKYILFCLSDRDSQTNALAALDLATFKLSLFSSEGFLNEFAFSPDGKVLAVELAPGKLSLIELPNKRRELALPQDGPVSSIAFSSSGTRLAVAQISRRSRNSVAIFEQNDQKLLRTWRVPGRPLDKLEFSSDGKYLAALEGITESGNGQTMKIQLFGMDSGTQRQTLDTGWNAISDIGFLEDGTEIYALQHKDLLRVGVPALKRLEERALKTDLNSWPEVNKTSDHLLVGEKQELVLYELASGEAVFRVPHGVEGFFNSEDSRVEVRAEDFQTSVYDLKGNRLNVAAKHPELLRPVKTKGWGGDYFLTVRSPVNGREVAALKVLSLTNTGIEWVAWTSENKITGSPNWRDCAQLNWRGGAPRDRVDRDLVRNGFLHPEILSGELSRPKSYQPIQHGAGNASTLLSAVLENPGSWNQMCIGIATKPLSELPLHGFSRRWRTYYISTSNLEQLRDLRDDVIEEICARILERKSDYALDAQYQYEAVAGARKNWLDPASEIGKPSEELENLLLILLDLNAVEALPTLLDLEQQLNEYASFHLPDEILRDDKERRVAYLPHVQLLSVMTAILKNENVVFESELSFELKDTKTYDWSDMSEEILQVRSYNYNKSSRDVITQQAEDYLSSTDPKQFIGPNAMTKNAWIR